MQGENTEADLSKETIPLNVPYEAMKGVLEYCELFNFEPIDQNSEYVPYKIQLQLNPKAIDYGDLMTTKEIIFFQPKNLDQIIAMTNAANYLDVPFVLDAMCAAIALNMRKTARDF